MQAPGLEIRRYAFRIQRGAPGLSNIKSADIPTITHVTNYLANLFDTRILYTPQAFLYEFLSVSHRPRKALLVHALMSMNSLDGIFADDAFDMYDYILCAGPHHVASFRTLALRRSALLGKTLLPAGYRKLDLMLASYSERQRSTDPAAKLTSSTLQLTILNPISA